MTPLDNFTEFLLTYNHKRYIKSNLINNNLNSLVCFLSLCGSPTHHIEVKSSSPWQISNEPPSCDPASLNMTRKITRTAGGSGTKITTGATGSHFVNKIRWRWWWQVTDDQIKTTRDEKLQDKMSQEMSNGQDSQNVTTTGALVDSDLLQSGQYARPVYTVNTKQLQNSQTLGNGIVTNISECSVSANSLHAKKCRVGVNIEGILALHLLQSITYRNFPNTAPTKRQHLKQTGGKQIIGRTQLLLLSDRAQVNLGSSSIFNRAFPGFSYKIIENREFFPIIWTPPVHVYNAAIHTYVYYTVLVLSVFSLLNTSQKPITMYFSSSQS